MITAMDDEMCFLEAEEVQMLFSNEFVTLCLN